MYQYNETVMFLLIMEKLYVLMGNVKLLSGIKQHVKTRHFMALPQPESLVMYVAPDTIEDHADARVLGYYLEPWSHLSLGCYWGPSLGPWSYHSQ